MKPLVTTLMVALFLGFIGGSFLLLSFTFEEDGRAEQLRRAEQRRVLIQDCAQRGGVWNEGVLRGSPAMWCASQARPAN